MVTKPFTIGISVFLLLGIVAVLAYRENSLFTTSAPTCPDDFPNTDVGSKAYLAAIDAWTNEFFDNNPDADLGEWSEARYQFWVENGCAEAIKRYQESKNNDY